MRPDPDWPWPLGGVERLGRKVRFARLIHRPQEMERYLVLPATDDPWVTLAAVGVQTGGNLWWQALLTAGSMIVVVNSVLAGVVGGLLWRSVAGPSGLLPLALAAAVGFLLSLVSQGSYGQRAFRRDLEASTVAFPAAKQDR